MRIAVDAMGGDYAPREIVLGAVDAANQLGMEVLLVGDENAIRNELASCTLTEGRVRVVHSTQVVEMDEHPGVALRKKKDSSIVVATSLVKEGQAQALVSCGNTGAQMAAALFILGRFDNVERPAIAAHIPLRDGYTVLLDVGANVDCKAKQLVQFALMGRAYASILTGNPQPSVGLLSNGEEESKGNQAVLEAHAMLRDVPGLNFAGNIEGRDIFAGKSDVVVCDGFVGNVVLKSVEGFMFLVMNELKDRLEGKELGVLNGFDYHQVGGAPLLGVEGVSVVCHGSSRARAVANGIKVAVRCVEQNMVSRLKTELEGVKVRLLGR